MKAIGKKATDQSVVKGETDIVEKGKTKVLTEGQWEKGVYVNPKRKGYRAVIVEEVMEPTQKSQREARGYYLNEYQNELERQLNASLRAKYNVKINHDVVESITY
jgi:peptidyl-prolyl cis-trans isomerase SurA